MAIFSCFSLRFFQPKNSKNASSPKCCEPESKKGEAAVKAEAKAEEETEKACVASKHDPVTIMEISSLMTLVSLRSFEYYAISLQFMQ